MRCSISKLVSFLISHTYPKFPETNLTYITRATRSQRKLKEKGLQQQNPHWQEFACCVWMPAAERFLPVVVQPDTRERIYRLRHNIGFLVFRTDRRLRMGLQSGRRRPAASEHLYVVR